MSNLNQWYGENSINWGKSYTESWWGSVNETNSWGLIYPANAEGSIFTADATNVFADSSTIKADNGTSGVDAPVISGNSLSDGLTLTSGQVPYFFGNIDHANYTGGSSLLGQVITTAAGQTTLTESQIKSIALWFAGLTDMTIDTWYSVESTFKLVETEADPDNILHNMTDKTGAQVKYINSPVTPGLYVVLIKGGTHNPISAGGRQFGTVGEAWNDRDIIKY